MHKLVKKYQDGGNTNNVGAKSLFQLLGGWGTVGMTANLLNGFIPRTLESNTSNTVNAITGALSSVPVIGKYAALGGLAFNGLNYLGSSKLETLKNTQEAEDALALGGSGYGSVLDLWSKAKEYSGKRVGLFDRKSKYNDMIFNANYDMAKFQGIMDLQRSNSLLTALMEDRWNEHTMTDMNGGFGNISFGRLGLKIEILPRVHAILNTPKVMDTLEELEDIPEFKEGGKMNVIPEGSLHARLHHMENAEGLTKKGIPVVSIAEGGELEQQAEIELNEIIFNLEVTLTLEKLMLDGSDSAAIEAGKLLVKEIFENTDDRTGLLKLLEPEKKEATPEEVVQQHRAFLQGGVIERIKGLSPEQLDKLTQYLNSIEA